MATTHSIDAVRLASPIDDSSHERVVRRDGTAVFTPRQVFLPLAAACALGVFIIGLLARDAAVATAAELSFAIASVIAFWLATSRDGAKLQRIVAVAALGATAALPGWFFGASSASRRAAERTARSSSSETAQ